MKADPEGDRFQTLLLSRFTDVGFGCDSRQGYGVVDGIADELPVELAAVFGRERRGVGPDHLVVEVHDGHRVPLGVQLINDVRAEDLDREVADPGRKRRVDSPYFTVDNSN